MKWCSCSFVVCKYDLHALVAEFLLFHLMCVTTLLLQKLIPISQYHLGRPELSIDLIPALSSTKFRNYGCHSDWRNAEFLNDREERRETVFNQSCRRSILICLIRSLFESTWHIRSVLREVNLEKQKLQPVPVREVELIKLNKMRIFKYKCLKMFLAKSRSANKMQETLFVWSLRANLICLLCYYNCELYYAIRPHAFAIQENALVSRLHHKGMENFVVKIVGLWFHTNLPPTWKYGHK